MRASRICALALALCLPWAARAEWHMFTDAPEGLAGADMLVGGFDGEVTVSFLGDCTLGGESRFARSNRGFVKTVEREGLAYPFKNLRALLQADDVSVVNLEGVLSDRSLKKVKKTYNFQGPAAYAEILSLGGVELAGLANNHTRDYGKAGYLDTMAALDAEGIAYFGTDRAAIWERDGVMIGFTGSSFSLTGTAKKTLEKQMRALREAGCQIVIHSMHAGTEYKKSPSNQQRKAASTAIALGADLVVGHHPHIVQGYDLLDGAPVVYSLGNAVFGGNSDPRDHDALLLQAVFTFSGGEVCGLRLRFWPISVSGRANGNDYQPALLSGADAQRVLDKMEASTGVALPAFRPETGAEVVVEVRKGER